MQITLQRIARVTSTMDVVRGMAERGEAAGAAVLAEEQTAGRGRAGHAWYSPGGDSIHLSVLLRPLITPAQAGWLTMAVALAVCDACDAAGARARLKWFNDVMVAGRKVAGVLVESALSGERFEWVVAGIGLNVNTRFDGAPELVRAGAISLAEARGSPCEREAVLADLLRAMQARLAALDVGSPARDYAARLDTLGQTVRIDLGGGIVAGVAEGVAADGALIVRAADGAVRAVRAGTLD